MGPNWIFIDRRGINEPEEESTTREEEKSRQEDRKNEAKNEGFYLRWPIISGEERSRSPFKIWPDLGSELKRRDLKPARTVAGNPGQSADKQTRRE